MIGLFYFETTTILWKRKIQSVDRCSILIKKAHHECWYSKQACALSLEINNYGPVFCNFSMFLISEGFYRFWLFLSINRYIKMPFELFLYLSSFFKKKNISLKAFLDCISVAVCLTALDRCTLRPLTSAPRNRKRRSNFRRYLKPCLLLQKVVHT